MKLSAYCDFYTDNSYFLFDRKKQIADFKIHSLEKIGHFIDKKPVVGAPFVEIISQKYEQGFSRMVDECFGGQTINIEKRLKIPGMEDVLIQVVLTPVVTDNEQSAVVCTVIDSNRKSNQMKLLDEYSFLASHDLRAPITNILSLSSMMELPIETYDRRKIKGLLNDINEQAVKLDDIINMMNRVVNQGQQANEFVADVTNTNSKHIMLVDDDSLTNKLHHMIITKNNKNKKVVQFDNPAFALDYLNDNRPDLILLDLNMPEIDGWTFLRLLEERNIEVDVVIISSTIDPADKARAQSFRMVKDFVTKPLTYEKIKHLVDVSNN
jgi:CheY-like chemotaxis protein